ncbi:ultraviolet-B receptor UVR8 isoform X1 [Arabidopsis lyrata subsp. lyrata]|uniref:ultraviolet-B receptor UVR8 isoform X1 n=1 Tax=Arabidopsis lyrata subsp. lyrata TaxID=81972 RepID=UPI000A29D24F|nr:ultraviolet-B receptor UVR8 isoform X1 [Arabidopsis lyrata subsp. lyrata]|eukprot:XP_020881323.1 ultraviolet-B receptor UVR8 isoform X1 [Arabidopsis lyrata subsp. lyrata]
MNGNIGGKVPIGECKATVVYMSGYLPGAAPEKSPILSPVPVRLPAAVHGGDSWKDVCGGGCGFAMAISEKGKLITWGSTDDEGQSYVASGKHGETPELFPLPTEAPVVQASSGWAHCAVVTEAGEAFTWGWKECIPSKDPVGKQQSGSSEQVSQPSQGSNAASGMTLQNETRKVGEDSVKRRRVSTAKDETEGHTSGGDFFATAPSLVSVGLGVRITSVATGGRHTLALSVSDIGQIWGWGYGGEGQLGLGSRIKMVSSPHLIPCLESIGSGKERSFILHQGGTTTTSTQVSREPGRYIKAISCGGRHSAAITDAGGLITFGWGLYGQCGHGNTNDQLRPMAVSSMKSVRMESVAAGLWHTICISSDGKVYAFGGNQFGQLGTGTDHAEILPRLLGGQNLEGKYAKAVSCGARHSAVLAEDGQLLCWGWNKYGQLGLGDTNDRSIPTQVQLDGCRLRKVACGWWHTLLLADIPT